MAINQQKTVPKLSTNLPKTVRTLLLRMVCAWHVRQKAHQWTIELTLATIFGRIALADGDSILRRAVFDGDSLCPRRPGGPRAVGRPRMTWAKATRDEALKVAGGDVQLADALGSGEGRDARLKNWRLMVKSCLSRGD